MSKHFPPLVRAKLMNEVIVRPTLVNRILSPQDMIDATRRTQCVDPAIVTRMPGRGEIIETVSVYFFRPERFFGDREVRSEFKLADPYAVSSVNETDPAFGDAYFNGTYWWDAGRWCFILFGQWYRQRAVLVDCDAPGWPLYPLLATVRKQRIA